MTRDHFSNPSAPNAFTVMEYCNTGIYIQMLFLIITLHYIYI